ncbi:MAG: signal peptide peptidase SppA, partial [Pseudomonadota bacterium]|nr:signal peptide peptidase SppA [Pseudomonadota bacterium]
MLRKLSRLMVRLCAIVGFLVLLTMTLGVLGTLGLIERTQPLPDKILLSFDFSIEIAEGGPSNLAESLMGAGSDLADVVAALDMAANDSRVTGLVAQIDDAGFGLAQAQELRAAVERFRATGKFAIVHATSFGELMPGNRPYYLAAAFDHIYLQPVGFLGLSGIALEGIYLGEVLK